MATNDMRLNLAIPSGWKEGGDMKKAIGVIGFIGAVCIGFSISTAAGIVAIILSWLVARKLEA
jgi:hypothetical protein